MNYQELWQSLEPRYDASEAKAITRTVLEVKFGLTLTDIVCGKVNELSANNSETLRKIFSRLLQGEPVQYVLGEADFDGHIFQVAPGILIPRPETEDLVEAVSCWWDERAKQLAGEADTGNPRLLDIGTGSGCIAVSLSLRHPQAKVTAWDISDSALAMARKNAEKLSANVTVERQDALRPPADQGKWDAIVSNPPYITYQEQAEMEANVLEHEPHLALFVPDEDPLKFYLAIARYALSALREEGLLAFEINPLFAERLTETLRQMGFPQVTILPDRYGKQRIALALAPKRLFA